MKIFDLLKKNEGSNENEEATRAEEATNEEVAEEAVSEEVTLGTKIKVIAALVVVGFACGIAYWVQEPSEIKVDVLSSDAGEEEAMPLDSTALGTGAENTSSKTETSEADLSGTSMVAAADETAGAVQEVAIVDFTFTPGNIEVGKGTTVIWTNMDAVAHTVTSDTFASETLNPGDSFTYTFNEEGTFSYFCSIHPQMTGEVTVTAATVTPEATANEPLSGSAPETNEELMTPDVLTLDEETPTAVSINPSDLLTEESTTEEPVILSVPQDMEVHTAAAEDMSGREIASSGPEDILYVGLLGAILYFTRRKFLGAIR